MPDWKGGQHNQHVGGSFNRNTTGGDRMGKQIQRLMADGRARAALSDPSKSRNEKIQIIVQVLGVSGPEAENILNHL